MPDERDLENRGQSDQIQAAREREARRHLVGRGAGELAVPPWRPPPVPPSAVDLIQFALWRSSNLDPADFLAALILLPAARAELDELETGLLFTARSAGLTWAQMAAAIGLRSPQACQQRYDRLVARQDPTS